MVDDVLRIDQVARYQLRHGACLDPSGPAATADLCVTVGGAAGDPAAAEAVETDLQAIRGELARNPKAEVAPGIKARQAVRMDDTALLDLVLNAGVRSVRRVNDVPLWDPEQAILDPDVHGYEDQEAVDEEPATTSGGATSTTGTGSESTTGGDSGTTSTNVDHPGDQEYWSGDPEPFATDHFLTGFTMDRHIVGDWTKVFAEETWWHGRYYVSFDYAIRLGAGIRVPFSLDVDHVSGGPGSSTIDLTVDTLDVSGDDGVLDAVGLAPESHFDGHEVVLHASVKCALKISIPGPDLNETCEDRLPISEIDWSRHYLPPLGRDEPIVLGDWWLEGEDTGLDFSIPGLSQDSAWARIDLGLQAELTNGRVGVDIRPYEHNAITDGPVGRVWIGSSDPQRLSLVRSQADAPFGFSVADPRYAFDVSLLPMLRIDAGVDVGAWSKTWTPLIPLDFLRLSQSVYLGHHEGTVDIHDYTFQWLDEAIDDDASTTGSDSDSTTTWSGWNSTGGTGTTATAG